MHAFFSSGVFATNSISKPGIKTFYFTVCCLTLKDSIEKKKQFS